MGRPTSLARLALGGAIAVLLCALAQTSQAQEPPVQGGLEERLRRQEEDIRALREGYARQNEEIRKLKAQASQRSLPPSLPWESLVRLSGFVQADGVLHRQSSQDEVTNAGVPLNQDRFLIRRAHVRIDTDQGVVSGALELDANTVNGASARIFEAEVSARWQGPDRKGPPLFMATLGLFKIPFGVEGPERDTARLFLERSTVSRALFPGSSDLGARLQGGYRFIRYAFGLMNGEPTAEQGFPALDPNHAKDLVGRVGVDVAVTPAVRVTAGVSALSGDGFHKGTPSTKDVLVWRDANQDGLVQLSEIQVIAGSPATASTSFHRFAIGADLRVVAALPYLGELCLMGELVRASNLDRGLEPADPIGAGRDFRELGFYAGVTQEVTKWAMLGLRYDRYDPDADASEQRALHRVPRDSTYSTLAVAIAARYRPGRLVLEYDHNQNALGRTDGGVPTTLLDDALTLRGEVILLMRRHWAPFFVLLSACSGETADRGLASWMVVSEAIFVEGAMPSAQAGPEVASVDLASNAVRAGQADRPLHGALGPTATAAAIGLTGDQGYWIAPAGLADIEAPGFPTFDVKMSFSRDLPTGRYDLVVRAVDADQQYGPPNTSVLSAAGALVPEGALVFSLQWDTESDLDLRIVDPAGTEIWKRNINSYQAPPPGQPMDPDAWQNGGILDFDSNAACVIDGKRQENVVWAKAAPKGHYLARVDTFSLCGEPSAHWRLAALLNGKIVTFAEGTSTDFDASMPHDRGAGVLALELDVP